MIRVSIDVRKAWAFPRGALALFALEGEIGGLYNLKQPQLQSLAKAAQGEAFKGKPGQTASVAWGGGKLLLAGLGKREKLDLQKFREAAAALAKAAEKKYPVLGVALPSSAPSGGSALEIAGAAAEGLLLATYAFDKYKKPSADDKTPLKQAVLLAETPAMKRQAEGALRQARVCADAIALVRDLVNEGPSDKEPQALAALAESLGGAGVTVETWGAKELSERGMNAILGVARGSSVEPRFVHLVYKPEGAPKLKLGLVGKGITFDSGGLSLKPPQSMETMKMDMAGAAAVLAVFQALPKLRPQVEVHGFAPFTYNMPGGNAIKPGDIVRASNGKTIEVLNTDAEGRLVLADALAYACRQKLDAIFDLATLTGAALVALGSAVTAALTTSPQHLRAVQAAAEKAGEKIWELPLVEEYAEGLKSKVADLQNISSIRGEAGTIIGGLFLKEFVDSAPWIHFDIAGTAWADKGSPLCPPGGTGALVRTLLNYILSL